MQIRTAQKILYDGLFKDTEGHHNIVNHVNKLTLNTQGVAELLRAINQNDYESPIFYDHHADLYLLFLIKDGKLHTNPELNFYSGMTFYFYIMAGKEYPHQTINNPTDRIFGLSKMLSFNENGKLSVIGQYYLDNLKISLKLFDVELDIEQIKSYILQLPLSEQSLLIISNYSDYEHRRIGAHLPLVNPEWHVNSANTNDSPMVDALYLPAFSIFNYLLKMISGQDLSLQFRLGTFDETENLEGAKKNKVYVPLYSSLITHYEDRVDPYNCFILLKSMKYLVFAFTRSLMDKKDIQFTFNQFIPYLSFMQKIALENNDERWSTQLQSSIKNCGWLLVSPLNQCRKRDRLFRIFLEKNLEITSTETEISLTMNNIIMCVFGFLYPKNTQYEKDIWIKLLITQIHTLSLASLPSSVDYMLIKAIFYLANNHCYTPQAFMILDVKGKPTAYTVSGLGCLHYNTRSKEINSDVASQLIKASFIPEYLQDLLLNSTNLLLSSRVEHISNLNLKSPAKLICQFNVFRRREASEPDDAELTPSNRM